jgi:transglutaminase-like putative cysteine protease
MIVRESRESAEAGGVPSGEALDLTSAAAIPAGKEIADPRSASRLVLRVTGIPDGQNLSYPPRQVLEGSELVIEREDVDSLRSFALPQTDPLFAPDLEATAFVQSDDPRIRDLARTIVGDETDARRAARRLLDWVYENVRKVPTVSVPSAVDVLASREGDCNEHAVLYAALARAAGLPTRIVAGTVYMPGDGAAGGAFYYHSWVDVWLGRWTALDPTFGQFPADATHVKFLEGGPEAHAALLRWIGRIQVAVENVG